MKISIIIPYNKGVDYLRDCLDSLREQTGQELEILLICDRVHKKDLDFLAEYQDLPIYVYHLKGKTGVAAARNMGLDHATGDYIYFLDSDDYLYGDVIGALVMEAQDGDEDIIYGKKKSTWLGRNVYLTRIREEEAEEFEEESDSRDMSDQSQEEDSDEKKDGSDDDGSEEESGEHMDDEDTTDHDDQANQSIQEVKSAVADEEQSNPVEVERNRAYRILIRKRKGVRNISVLNILFNRSFLERNQLRFIEKLLYMSDVPFLLEAMSKTDKYKAVMNVRYIKRKHNDPVNLPALSQIKDPNRFYEFIEMYYETIKRLPEDSPLKDLLDRKYIAYFAKVYAPRLKRSKNPAWRNENFLMMHKIVKGTNPEVLRSLKGYKKRIIKALIQNKVRKSLIIVTLHLAHLKSKKILKNRKAFARFLYIHNFVKKPIKENWILFESFFGKSYSGNPKYIYEYLAKNYGDQYKFIWIIDNKNTKIPYKHKEIKRFGILYSYYLARCKYNIFNSRQPEWVIKRDGSIFLQTWHGTPLKKLVFDIEDISSASPKYKQQVYNQSRAWDYLIAPNEFSSQTFRRCFMFENTMLDTGYPRNDILHSPNMVDITKKLKEKLGIPSDKKVILYAPTWRDDEFYEKGKYKFELQLNLDYMREELGDQYVLILRTHYFIADYLDVRSYQGFAFNLSKYDDISELYLISDILITDYSSVFFDYANLKRPILFYTYDLEKYRDVLRGFYFDIEKEVPGPLLYTTEDVVRAIENIETVIDEYSQRYHEFYHRFCAWEDGHAAEKVVKSVFGK